MIVEYIRYEIPADRRADFERAYERAVTLLEASPHCLRYELARCVEDESSYVLRIEWDSLDGHLEGFRKSSDFRSFFGAVRPFVDDIKEMRHYAVTLLG